MALNGILASSHWQDLLTYDVFADRSLNIKISVL